MKTRNQVYISLIENVAYIAHSNGIISDDDCLEVVDSYVPTGNVGNCADFLLPKISTSLSLTSLVHSLKHAIAAGASLLEDVEVPVGMSLTLDRNADRKDQIQKFTYNDPDLVIVPAVVLRNSGTAVSLSSLAQPVWLAVERVLVCICEEQEKIREFLSLLENDNEESYYILTSHPDDHWRLFCFAMLSHINRSSIERDPELNYSQPVLSSSLLLLPNRKYEQYIDVFNVLNEAKHSTDILNRYLKTYQIVEYFAYRNKLAQVVNSRSTIRNSLVRDIIQWTGGNNPTREKEIIVNSFKKVFTNIKLTITTVDLMPFQPFLKDYYQIDISDTTHFPHSDQLIGNIVYSIRCSIVHNKESELHFSYGNVYEYKVVIPLMRLLVKTLEKMIVDFIGSNSRVEFTNESVRLY